MKTETKISFRLSQNADGVSENHHAGITHLDVENSQKSASGSEAVNVFSVSGSTTIPFLHPGCIVDIHMRKPDSNETSYFTKVMGTEAVHEIDTIGQVAIPEVGDLVMVNFVHSHPDRPFVMGGMFHGGVGLEGGADNCVKSIQLRSGNDIHLDTFPIPLI